MARIPRWPDKDPNEVVAYRVDWSERLDDDTIDTSEFSVVSGTVTIVEDVDSPTSTSVALSGGTLNETCEILNRITTTGGETFDQTVMLRIRKR